jgi:hypothetical protein
MSDTTWEEVDYRAGSRTAPAIDAFLGAVAEQFVNGGCVLRQFEARDQARFDSALAHDLRGLEQMLAAFLRRPEVHAGLEEVKIASAARTLPAFRTIGAFELEGALAHTLLTGGAYTRGVGSEERARLIAREFLDALLEDRLSCTVFVLEGAWTPWFFDVAWDHSYVLIDPGARSWWTLFMTDTD